MKALEKVQNLWKLLKFKLKRAKRSETVFVEFTDFFISEKIFNLYGLYNLPSSMSNIAEKKRNWLFEASIFSIALFMVVSLISLCIGLTNDGTLLVLYENSIAFVFEPLLLVKTFLIAYFYRYKLREVVEILESYYPNDGWNQHVFQVSRHLRILKIYEKLTLVSYVMAFTSFCFMPYFVQLYGFLTSQKFELDSILQFYLPIIDQNQLIVNIVLDLLVLFSFYSGSVFMVMTDLLYVELVALATMELSIVGQLMSEINPDEGIDSARKELEKLIKVHEVLIDVTRKLNEIFSVIMFTDIFGIIGLMCVSAFMTFSGISWLLFTRYIFVFLNATWNVYNHCFFGDLLSEASMKISDDAYNSNWVNGDRNYRKRIQFVMLRAQKAQVLRGLQYLEANLETFVWAVNITYSYYSVMVAVYESN